VEIISHCVWLYYRFPLSLRDVQEMMAERGVIVSYESIHQWCRKFGQSFANGLRRRRPHPGDKWHLDEVFSKINGKTHYLWRAVDQHGAVLDILVTSRRDTKAATRFFRKLLKGLEYVPRVLVTDSWPATAWYAPGDARGGAPPVEVSEQSGGELPPTHPPARTGHEKVPLTRRRAEVPVGVQRDITALSAPSTQTHRSRLPPRDGHPIHRLERGRRRARSRLTQVAAEPHPG
jgi:transposase-like protein